MSALDDPLGRLGDLLAAAKAAGADAADAVLAHGIALSHAQRLGQLERLEREEGQDLGLRVLIGKRQAIVSSSDCDPKGFAALAERAVAMARSVPEDAFCGLAEPGQLATEVRDLDTHDAAEPAPETLIERARACEDAARAVKGVSNSEGAEASWSSSLIALAASNGFAGSYRISRQSVGAAVLAGEGLEMQRDYDFASAVYGADLEDPAAVGRRAGERAVRRLGARKAATAKVPVVYDPRVSGGLVGHLASAVNGTAVARGTSYLKDKMGQAVAAAGITIVDDPHRPRGLRSKPFDAEGVANRRREVVSAGVLKTWILDLRAARQLGLETTGHASRGTSGPPGPAATNLYLEAGPESPEDLIAAIDQGFYVTEMIGMGVNGVTGDYSRGAVGFWIEKGELTHPVHEVTVAGNLKTMFQAMNPGQRPRVPLRRQRAHGAGRRGDGGGGVRGD